jgi:hypothetical protein
MSDRQLALDGPGWMSPVDKEAAAFLWRVVLNPKDKNQPGLADSNVSARVTARIGTGNSHQALFERACPGPMDRPHPARIKMLAVAFRMNKNNRGGHFYVTETGSWARWNYARRCIADNRSNGKVRCEADITHEQAAGAELEDALLCRLDYKLAEAFFRTPLLGFFLLWFCWLCWVDSPPERQRRNIKTFRRGEAPFHRQHVTRPDKSEEIRLVRLYRAGDVIAGNTLIASHIWITKTIAKKYQDEAEFDDLVQEGTFGLYKALQKFDPDSDRRFSTLAYRAVAWAIRDYLDKLRQLQRHESSDEITDKGGSDALGLYRSISVERKILFD